MSYLGVSAPAWTVYQGSWQDQSSGGAYIWTLAPKPAQLVTASIVILITIAGTSSWPIFSLLIWSLTERGLEDDTENRTVFDLQRQAALRNSPHPANATRTLYSLIWNWRGHGHHAFRSVPLLLLYIVLLSGWLLAGLFAPQIYTHSSRGALIAPESLCRSDPGQTITGGNVDWPETAKLLAQADRVSQYVDLCYNQGEVPFSTCDKFAVPRIQYTATSSQPCPFPKSSTCVSVNSSAVLLDSGWMDSNYDFGINGRDQDRVQFRKLTTCSPVVLGSMEDCSVLNTLDFQGVPAGTLRCWYWLTNGTNPIQYDLTRKINGPLVYAIEWYKNETKGYRMNETLYSDNMHADFTSFTFAPNTLIPNIETPSYDPIFKTRVSPADDGSGTLLAYAANLTMVGCTDQRQIRYKINDKIIESAPLSSSELITGPMKDARMNKLVSNAQFSSLARISVSEPAFMEPVLLKGLPSLLASKTIYPAERGPVQLRPLPVDQWKEEVKYIFAQSLAAMQERVMLTATESSQKVMAEAYANYSLPGPVFDKSQCSQQRIMNNGGNVNINLNAFIPVIVICSLLILLGWSFEDIFYFVVSRNPRWKPFRDRWLAQGIYHVQMEALIEREGIKNWFDTDRPTPKSWDRNAVVDTPSGTEKARMSTFSRASVGTIVRYVPK